MRKRDEISLPTSTLNRSQPDEPLFIICGRDQLAAEAVDHWIYLAEREGVSLAKIQEARTLYVDILSWQRANGSKLPD